MALMLKERGEHMQWYQDELLHMAKDLGLRLLPAFNTSSGLPYPRVRHNTHRISSLFSNASQFFCFFCLNAMLSFNVATVWTLFTTD